MLVVDKAVDPVIFRYGHCSKDPLSQVPRTAETCG